MGFYWILIAVMILPVVMLTVKHFWASRKPTKPQVHAYPFPILSNGKFYEKPAFRAVDWSQEPRNKAFDWPQP